MDDIVETLSAALKIDVAGITVEHVLKAVILLAVCLLAVKFLMKVADRTLARTELDSSLRTFIRTAVKIVLLFITVLLVAGELNINVTSLVAVLSVFGLAISLAVQNSLSNVAGGIQLLTSKPFKQGDYVQAGGIEGTVHEVGVVYTRIHTWDNKLIQVPNSQIAAEKIVNYTAEPERRVDLTFSISYDAPADTVRQVIRQVIGTHPLTFATPEPTVRVSKYGDSAIEYTMKVWCATGDYWTVYYDMLEQVKSALDAAGVEMTYPHVNVHMVTPPGAEKKQI